MPNDPMWDAQPPGAYADDAAPPDYDEVKCEACGHLFDKDDCVPMAEIDGSKGYVCWRCADAILAMNEGRVA